jgi:hypothetical protein
MITVKVSVNILATRMGILLIRIPYINQRRTPKLKRRYINNDISPADFVL